MPGLEIKDAYSMLVATRNLEINLFWQRSNYFLALNSALALGFFNLKETTYALLFIALGVLASWLWYQVCLGGKYWQTRWEQRLMAYEREHLDDLRFFAADRDRIVKDVKEGIAFHPAGGFKAWIYGQMLANKPSVSYSMIRLSLVFVLAWSIIAAAKIWQTVSAITGTPPA